jgi:hypothetical protein
VKNEERERKETEVSASKLQNISSFLSAKYKNIRDDNFVSGARASESVEMDTGVRETETYPISDRINVDVDTGVRFEPKPSSSKVVNVSTSLNTAIRISVGKMLNRLPIRRTLNILRV